MYVVNQTSGASALGVQRVLGFGSYRTAWNWLHKLRRAMVRPGRDGLSGTVEMDEVYIGGERSGKRGRGAAGKALALIAAQVDGSKIGRIGLARVADASAPVLAQATRAAVSPGSQVLTDGVSELRKEQADHMTPRFERAGFFLYAGGAGQLRHQMRGNEIAELPKDRELGAGWRGARFLFHSRLVAGKTSRANSPSHQMMG